MGTGTPTPTPTPASAAIASAADACPSSEDAPTTALAVYAALLCEVSPPALRLLAQPSSGDARVLVAVCLRRLLPNLFATVAALYPGDLLQTALTHCRGQGQGQGQGQRGRGGRLADGLLLCLTEVLRVLPQLLADRAPVPQYAVRLLADLLLASPSVAMVVCYEMQLDFESCGCGLSKGGAEGGALVAHVAHRRPLLLDMISRIIPAAAGALYCRSAHRRDQEEEEGEEGEEGGRGGRGSLGPQPDSQAGVCLRMLLAAAAPAATRAFLAGLSLSPSDGGGGCQLPGDALQVGTVGCI
jgi:hypothetical protein